MRYRKSDVQEYNNLPAVNVKVYAIGGDWLTGAKRFAADEDAPPEFVEWYEDFEDPDGTWFGAACESGWEMLDQDASEILGSRIYQEGRSGGWCVVRDLPELAEWDAIQLGRWAKFERYARLLAEDIPYQVAALVYMNEWLPEQERKRQCEQQWTADLLASLA